MPNLSNIILLRATAIILAFGMLFARLGELPLRDPDEGRNAEIAREMMLSNSWLTPTFNGVTRLDKPAAYFKVVSFSYKLFGVSEFSARLPSAIAALAILLMVYAFARRHYDEFTAAFAVLVLTTAPLFFAFGREVILDMMFTCFVCGAIFSGFCAEQSANSGRTWYLCGAASSALATLWKGPVGFLVPTIVLGLFNLIQRN
jgi:4-amino-4-deoxy-L-arabinose transferase-like glycosyltransferase